MRLRLLHTSLIVSLCALLTACTDTDLTSSTNDDGKTPIELSVGGADSNPVSRAVVIDGHGYITDFESDTRLHLLMISDDATTPTPSASEYTVTYATAKGTGNKPSSTTNGNKSTVSFASNEGIVRYWDDTHGRTSQLSIYGLATANVVQVQGAPWFQKLCGTGTGWANSGNESNSFVGNKNNSSVPWSLNPNDNYGKYIGANTSTGKWIIGDNTQSNNYLVQSMTSILYKDDLCYSNNISKRSDSDDTRLKYGTQVAKHFDSGTLVFRRAMSLLTFKFYPGGGFDPTSRTTFQFDTYNGKATNMAMKGFSKSGYLNIKTGEWSQVEGATNASYKGTSGYTWASIDNTDYGDPKYKGHNDNPDGTLPYWTLMAFVIPGDNLDVAEEGNLIFSIDGNEFTISKRELLAALKKNGANCDNGTPNGTVKEDYLKDHTKLKAGINYEFSITVGKTAINNITAQVVDWETVTASNHTPSNARISIEVEDRTNTIKETGLDIYRTNDDANVISDTWEHYEWFTGYTGSGNKATLAYDSENDKFTLSANPVWYWDNNKTYYHFRSVQPANHEVNLGSTTSGATADEKSDYLTLTAGSTTSGPYYTDVKWGAPFKKFSDGTIDSEDEKFVYSLTDGFDGDKVNQDPAVHQIYKAIGPTLNTIVIIPFHMMSDVTINLETTTGTDAVNLTDATIDIVGVYPTGKVLMSNGKVIPYGTKSTDASPTHILYNTLTGADPVSAYRYGAIPQDLTGVSLVIKTKDDNKYIVDMTKLYSKDVPPSTNNIKNPYTQTNGHYYITRWYPGFKYIYNLELTKKGIDNFKATIVNWEEVNVNQGGITIQ